MSDKGMLATAAALRSAGIGVVRFNFVYKEKGGRRPDFMPKLMDTVTAVIDRVRYELRSSRRPGRTASSSAAARWAAARHRCSPPWLRRHRTPATRIPAPPGRASPRSSATRTCRRSACRCCASTEHATRCARGRSWSAPSTTVTAPWQMEWVEGADHSFHVLKSSGRTDAEVMAGIAAVSRAWADRIPA